MADIITKLSVPDMSCGHCKASVEAALAPLSQSVAVDLAMRQVKVQGAADPAAIVSALNAIGFPAEILANS